MALKPISRIRLRSVFQSAIVPDTVGIKVYIRSPSTCGGSINTQASGTVSLSHEAPLSSENSARNEWRPGCLGVIRHTIDRALSRLKGIVFHALPSSEFIVVTSLA